VKLSIPLSIHNRAFLLGRALDSFLWQSLPPEEWEVILVDDLSTADQSEAYKRFLGKINLRHVYFDHTRHFMFKEKNPGWTPGQPKNWWKTPALTTNVGCFLSRAPVVGLFHPEILHAPDNFAKAVSILSVKPGYLFGKCWLGDQAVNDWITKKWPGPSWAEVVEKSGVQTCKFFKEEERYWYVSFLQREAVVKIGGVDFQYMHGNSYEDCDFKERVNRAGFPDIVDFSLQGIHQDHSSETDPHRIRDQKWLDSEVVNGQLFRTRLHRDGFPQPVNANVDWTANECVTRVVEYKVGSDKPVLT